MPFNPLTMIRLYVRAKKAFEYAKKKEVPGMYFAEYGKGLGWRLLRKGIRSGWGYVVTPVSCTRFFEYSYAINLLPPNSKKCLDVSSPRLFSLYVASNDKVRSVHMINPDRPDIKTTKIIINAMGVRNITTEASAIHELTNDGKKFDCIWSLSVIEHIHGDYDDVHALKIMYKLLEPGGRLIITVPVDKMFWEEYRDFKSYETQKPNKNGKFFFQRWYDKKTLEHRLFEEIETKPKVIRWYGEINPGRFQKYIEKWITQGRECTVEDPKEIADYYKEFECWEEMPGCGVCCFMIEK